MAEEKKQQIQIEVDDATSKGVFSNVAILFHNSNEFILDFAFVHAPKARVVSRVIINPSHAKSLLKALSQNVAQFEKQFGPIKETEGPDQNLGIKMSQN